MERNHSQVKANGLVLITVKWMGVGVHYDWRCSEEADAHWTNIGHRMVVKRQGQIKRTGFTL